MDYSTPRNSTTPVPNSRQAASEYLSRVIHNKIQSEGQHYQQQQQNQYGSQNQKFTKKKFKIFEKFPKFLPIFVFSAQTTREHRYKRLGWLCQKIPVDFQRLIADNS